VRVRVLTWNLQWRFGPWEDRLAAISAVLKGSAPDVVCLQEVWGEQDGRHQALLLAEGLGHHVVVPERPYRDGVCFGNAILSRWPVLEQETRPLADDRGRSHRHVVRALIGAPHANVSVFCTHLEWPYDRSALRVEQARTVAAFVLEHIVEPERSFPAILCGDMNAVPDSDEIRGLTGRSAALVPGLVFTDAWEVAGDGTPGFTWDPANPYLTESIWPYRRLDYVLVSWPRPRGLGRPERAWLAGKEPVAGVQPSDHYAVVVDLSTEPAGDGPTVPADAGMSRFEARSQ